jgi:hypothetical protein
MITTPDLIASLSTNPAPVRRLRPPFLRACCWLALAALILVLVGINHGLRPDFAKQLADRTYVVGLIASLLTGMLATVAAFMLSLPDRSRMYVLLPLPSLLVWMLTVGIDCLTDWISIGPAGLQLGDTASCFAILVLTSLPMSLALLVMLRYTVRLRPVAATWMGSLAVGALTASALSLFHDHDATVMVLIWNLGVVVLITALGRIFGHRLLAWIAPQPMDRAP